MNGLYLENPQKLAWGTVRDKKILGNDEVEIRVLYGGICGSDVGVYQGKLPHATYPVIPGHEILGIVKKAGDLATVKIGQRVVIQPNTYCGNCEYCLSGKTNICPDKKSLGINEDGGFAEEVIVSSKYVIPVPDAIPDERAVLIEPLSVIVHALKKVTINQHVSVAVVGCGTEGLLAVALATYYGGNITAIDIDQEKLYKVKEEYPGISIELPENVKKNHFDVVIEVAGAKESFEQSIDIVKPGGDVLAIGLPNIAEIPVVTLVRKEVTIKGSIIYNVPEDFLTSIDYLLDRNFHVEPIISKVFQVADYEKAYEMAISGKYRKILLKF